MRTYLYFALLRTSGIGPVAMRSVIETSSEYRVSPNELGELFVAGDIPGWLPLSPKQRTALKAILADATTRSMHDRLLSSGFLILGPDDPILPDRYWTRAHEFRLPLVFIYDGPDTPATWTQCTAVIGQRNAREDALAECRAIVTTLIERGHSVVTGDAVGIDRMAATTAIAHGGNALVIPPHGPVLTETARNDPGLCRLYQFAPGVAFSPGNAMTRNKTVAAVSDSMIVVSSGPRRDTNGRLSGTFDAAMQAVSMSVPLKLSTRLLHELPTADYDALHSHGALILQP